MKFAARYETLCALTRGEVETFAARDRRSGEKVLAYIFDCTEPPADQPSVQWILSSFAGMAPEPPGKVTEVGRYDVPSSAYIVAKWPGDEEVEAWVRGYKARMDAQVAADSTCPVLSPATGTEDSALAAVAGTPEESEEQVTRAMPAMGGQPAQSTQNSQSGFGFAEPSLAAGDLTQRFFSETRITNKGQGSRDPALAPLEMNSQDDESGLDSSEESKPHARPEDTAPFASSPVPEADPNWATQGSGQFTKLFMGDSFRSRSAPEGSAQPHDARPPSTSGEFTKLFQVPQDEPHRVAPSPDEDFETTPHQSESGFTRLFGPVEHEKPEKDSGIVAPKSSAGFSPAASSTEIFGWPVRAPDDQSEILRPSGTPSDTTKNGPIHESRDFTDSTAGAADYESASTPAFSRKDTFQEVAPWQPARVPEESESANATVIFDPRSAAGRTEAAAPSGPSDYTVFMQRSALSKLQAEAPKDASSEVSESSGPAGGGSTLPSATVPYQPPTFQPPTVSPPPVSVPAPAAPALSASAGPYVAPSSVAAPQAPAAPGQAPSGKVSYLPLIIILNVLLIVAILLILYFVIKH
jgi:hypothetical protein